MRLALAMAAGVVVAVGISSLANSIPEAFEAAAEASLPWTLSAGAAEVLVYVFVAVEFRRLLGVQPGFGRMVPFRVGLVLYGLGTLLPGSPAPGIVLATGELKRRGVSVGRSSLLFLGSAWFNARALLVLLALTATMAALRGRVPEGSAWLALGTSLFILGGLALTAGLLTRPAIADRAGAVLERLNWRGSGVANRSATERLRTTALEMLGSRNNRMVIAFAALGSWLADAVALRLALLAVGVHAGMGVVLIAYLASMAASFIPFLPGGLGLVELAIPGVLHHFGVKVELAIAGTLVWRSVALVLPGLAGLVALITLRMGSPPANAKA